MIAAWMLYSIVFSAVGLLAALAADRVVAIWRGAHRTVWLATLIVVTVAPVILATRSLWFGVIPPPVAPAAQAVVRATSGFDPLARAAWLIVSVVALGLYLGAMIRLRYRERLWSVGTLDGEAVLVARDLGPAVVGIVTPRVVVPEWAFELDVRSRRFMLRHEDEHIRAGDPQLLFVAALALVLFPWNPALWLITERLRLAIELDCDARVLLDGDEGGEYGTLLLAVCARRGTSPTLSPAFAEHTPHIEQRIVAMTQVRPRLAWLSSIALTAIAVAAIAVAAVVPHPGSLRKPPQYSRGVLALPGVTVTGYR